IKRHRLRGEAAAVLLWVSKFLARRLSRRPSRSTFLCFDPVNDDGPLSRPLPITVAASAEPWERQPRPMRWGSSGLLRCSLFGAAVEEIVSCLLRCLCSSCLRIHEDANSSTCAAPLQLSFTYLEKSTRKWEFSSR
ncbi:unnamed protein product, partial [Musa banksii]